MIAVIIQGHIGDGLIHPGAIFLSDITGKLFILSLMITLVGRGRVRQKLEQVSIRVKASNSQKVVVLSAPVFASRSAAASDLGATDHSSNAPVSTMSYGSSTHREAIVAAQT
ncbi:hypothetical protein FS749_005420 [Ceratobasidium sp. UAMH 11750]|nr:hypothetical protein FS749_005420 [Ceratobasidium sp. UAMH 11750]